MIPRSLPYARDRVIVGNKTGWDEEKKTSGRPARFAPTPRTSAAIAPATSSAICAPQHPRPRHQRRQRSAAHRRGDLAGDLRLFR